MESTQASIIWLKERSALGILPEPILARIAHSVEMITLATDQEIVVEGEFPDSVYILYQGRIDCFSEQVNGWAGSLLPGASILFQEMLLQLPSQQTIISRSTSKLWKLSKAELDAIAADHPELMQLVAQQVSQDLRQVSAQLARERERQNDLQPFLVTRAKRGIVGKSRYAVKLRRQIQDAAADRQSVLIFGEPGLDKDNIAALIHFSSAWRRSPIIQVNCTTLQASGVDLFGQAGGKPGLLENLGEGTLVLNNIQELPASLTDKLQALLQTGYYLPVARTAVMETAPIESKAQVIMVSEQVIPIIDHLVVHRIKVPPLRVRKADITLQANYYLRLIAQRRGISLRRIAPNALRRLVSYHFPGNLAELEDLIDRAMIQAPASGDLTEELFWPDRGIKQRFRLNLLNHYPWLRRFLISDWWPTRINYGLTSMLFPLVVVLLFIGPQQRSHNFALNLFWAWWWPLVLIGFPFVGRLWCSVCPFMIYGELAQKLSLRWFPRQLKRWPRQEAEQWGGWFLFALFLLIFLWEELWHLENTAYLSSCLLLLITAGAVIFSLIFERRFWCRYLCPIGGMNGLFAKLSLTELRGQQGICAAKCNTYHCYKGGGIEGEGQATGGCPVYSHPAQLQDNRDCVLCMTCLKACPHRSVEFNLRPPGIELWTTHEPRDYEVALLLLLFGGIFLHRLPELQIMVSLNFNLTNFWPHFLFSIAVLVIIALIPLIGDKIQRLWQPQSHPFTKLAYGYLPLLLGGTLAHYLDLGLGEAGRILPVTFLTFGASVENLPVLVAHPAVINFLQGTILILSVILTWIVTQNIARQSFWQLSVQHMTTVGLAIALWQIML